MTRIQRLGSISSRSRAGSAGGRAACAWLGLMTWLLAPLAFGQSAQLPEYQVKAAFLFNFAQFIQWPSGAFSDRSAPLVIGVLGNDPFGALLDEIVRDRQIDGRRIVIRRAQQVEDLKSSQMVFVSASEKDRIGEILSSLDDTSTVTVGETEGFALRGGIINFYTEGNKVRFEVNARAAERKGLKISAELLQRARIVGAGPIGPRE